jgi:acetoin utilization deacetylase AcuC-like enzyme
MTMILITSQRFEEHVTPPGHPERIERAHVFDAVAARWTVRGGQTMPPRPARYDELERVHDSRHIDRIEATSGKAVMLDPDTFTSPESHEIALLAAGAAIVATEHALDHREPALALVRPPGHHAERNRAMGFCLFNNVAVAAAAALARGLQRIAVVDIDVHHGNGTQEIFYEDRRVLYVSTHQFPFYPGTGSAGETGARDGLGFTVNVPMEAGCADADYDLVCRSVIVPVLDQFAPELLIVSAGYDAHERDPLASMRVTTAGYTAMVRLLCSVAGTKNAALAVVTEGGYDLQALAACLEATCAALDEPPQSLSRPSRDSAPRGERALAEVRAAQSRFWRAI